MISGGNKIDIDLRTADFGVWLALMQALRERYGERILVSDNPRQPNPLQSIADVTARACAYYQSLPKPKPEQP